LSTALFDDGQTLLMLAAEQGWTELFAAWGMAQGALSRAYTVVWMFPFRQSRPKMMMMMMVMMMMMIKAKKKK
jgi:hypothetical protein